TPSHPPGVIMRCRRSCCPEITRRSLRGARNNRLSVRAHGVQIYGQSTKIWHNKQLCLAGVPSAVGDRSTNVRLRGSNFMLHLESYHRKPMSLLMYVGDLRRSTRSRLHESY